MDKYTFTVSEPWDYTCSNGTNTLHGNIVRVIDDESIIFESNEEVVVEPENVRGHILLLLARHQGKKLNKSRKYQGTCGAGLVLESNYLTKNAKELEESSVYALIGALYESGKEPWVKS